MNTPIDFKFNTSPGNTVRIVNMALIQSGFLDEMTASYLRDYTSLRALQLGMADLLASEFLKEKVVVQRDLAGRPYLTDRANQISISHTSDYLAMVISTNSVLGLDIELLGRNIDHIAPRFTTSAEIELIRPYFPDNPILVIWSIKECLFKAAKLHGVLFTKHLHILTVSSIGFGTTTECQITHPELNASVKVVSRIFEPLVVSYIDQPTYGYESV